MNMNTNKKLLLNEAPKIIQIIDWNISICVCCVYIFLSGASSHTNEHFHIYLHLHTRREKNMNICFLSGNSSVRLVIINLLIGHSVQTQYRTMKFRLSRTKNWNKLMCQRANDHIRDRPEKSIFCVHTMTLNYRYKYVLSLFSFRPFPICSRKPISYS